MNISRKAPNTGSVKSKEMRRLQLALEESFTSTAYMFTSTPVSLLLPGYEIMNPLNTVLEKLLSDIYYIYFSL